MFCSIALALDRTSTLDSEQENLHTRRTPFPKVLHLDGQVSTRVPQTVKEQWNPRFYRLISHFHALTGVPVLLNTSFNVMGKPLIHSLEDAVSVFLTTGLDALVIDDYLITKPHDRSH